MHCLLFATVLLSGPATLESLRNEQPRAELAISIVDELFLGITDRTVTTDDPMDADEQTDEPPGRNEPRHEPLRTRGFPTGTRPDAAPL